MPTGQRWWIALAVCGALSAVPLTAAMVLSSSDRPKAPVEHAEAAPAVAEEEEPAIAAPRAHVDPAPAAEPEQFEPEPAASDSEAAEPAQVSGRVVDERGAAVTRFEVAVESFSNGKSDRKSARRRMTVEDESGRFVLDDLAPGSYVLAVRADGRPPALSDRIELASGDDERGVRIVLGQGGAIEGEVRDGEGPVEGARVSLDTASSAFGSTVSASSDESGGYRLEGVPNGPFSIRVEAKGYVTRIVSAVSVRPGQTARHDLDMRKAQAGEESEYTGIGAMLNVDARGIFIGHVIEAGPAEQAGLQRGDVLVRVDGEDARSWTVTQAVQRLRGPPRSRVSIRISRGAEELDFVVTRDRFVR
jgi:hypothetical protein